METPTLPEDYFFRVKEGKVEDWGLTQINARVELRKKSFIGSKWIGHLSILNTYDRHPTPKEVFDVMLELKTFWENKKVEVLPYGDYPPKKLEDL